MTLAGPGGTGKSAPGLFRGGRQAPGRRPQTAPSFLGWRRWPAPPSWSMRASPEPPGRAPERPRAYCWSALLATCATRRLPAGPRQLRQRAWPPSPGVGPGSLAAVPWLQDAEPPAEAALRASTARSRWRCRPCAARPSGCRRLEEYGRVASMCELFVERHWSRPTTGLRARPTRTPAVAGFCVRLEVCRWRSSSAAAPAGAASFTPTSAGWPASTSRPRLLTGGATRPRPATADAARSDRLEVRPARRRRRQASFPPARGLRRRLHTGTAAAVCAAERRARNTTLLKCSRVIACRKALLAPGGGLRQRSPRFRMLETIRRVRAPSSWTRQAKGTMHGPGTRARCSS